jgi:hypothetical protein
VVVQVPKYSTVYGFPCKEKKSRRCSSNACRWFCIELIEEKWPIFKEEPRNVRLSLAADAVNPFGEIHSTYSVWLVFVINNNLPPWMSIKREHTMLAMIVPGI